MFLIRLNLVATIFIVSAISAHAAFPLSRGVQELAAAERMSRDSCGRFAAEKRDNWKLPRCVLEVRRKISLAKLTLEPMMVGQPFVEKRMSIYMNCLDEYLRELPLLGHESEEVWQARYQENLVALDEAHEGLAAALNRFLVISF